MINWLKNLFSFGGSYLEGNKQPEYISTIENFLENLKPKRATKIAIFDLDEIEMQLESKNTNDKAIAAFKSGKIEEAVIGLLDAIRLNPMHEMAYCNLAYILIEIKQFSTAVKVLNIVLKINPNREEAIRYMAKARKYL